MHSFVKSNLKNILDRELIILWVFSIFSGLTLIALQNKEKLPLGKGDFVFLLTLFLCVALYRPRWIFFLFVSSIPLENIILSSGFLPLQLRPYQFLGAILVIALIILFVFKKISIKIIKPTWLDWLVFSLMPLSFLSLINSPEKNAVIKNNLILLSFVILYCAVRIFIRNREDIFKTAFFFLGSFLVVTAYGFYQILADKFNTRSFEVMFGRPNSTFAEPDWLGIYLCFALAVFLALTYYFIHEKKKFFLSKKYILLLLNVLILLNITLTILTLSRSAWIGTIVIVFLYLIANLPKKGENILNLGKFPREFIVISSIILVSLISIHFGKLSKFDIFDRVRSTATQEQKITIACENNLSLPQTVSNINELAKYNCRHINLEEIDLYKSQGKFIAEIFRKDPNVLTRNQIYKKSFAAIREHPVLGVGYGTITQILGADQRGSELNESNIFLQIWAGSGILGLAALIAVIGYLFIYSFRRVSPICPMNPVLIRYGMNKFFGCPIVQNNFEKAANVFMALGMTSLIVPNLFNAGIFMGTFWLGLGIIVSLRPNLRKNL